MRTCYNCPVCNKLLVLELCTHQIGKYLVYVYFNGDVNVWCSDKKVCGLNNPKRFDERYVDMIALLK
jgi:hypothetical protein